MADNWLQSFAVALGFEVNTATLSTAKRSIADYEKAVTDAEKRIEDARWAGAKTEEEIAKLTREANLKEARAALAAAQEREKSEKETARKREERHKEFVAGLNKAALAATAAATAISYAVSKVTSAFDNLGFVSQRTGASVQSLNSLGYAFKQTGGSAQQAIGAVEKFAQALRGNDGLKTFVQGLGVDTTKDMGDQYLDTITALSKHPYQVGMREAGMLGISEEDYKLVTDHIRQIREYRDEYNRTTRSLGIDSQKATEASQSFWRSLNKLQATASALTDKLMVSLAPALEAIVKRFNDWIEAHPEQVNKILTDITNGLVFIAEKFKQFGDWMIGGGGDELLKRWDDFARRVERVAKGIEFIAKAAGYIGFNSGAREYGGAHGDPGKTAALLNQLQAERGTGEDKRNLWQRYAPRVLGGKDAPIPGGTARIGAAARNQNAQTIIGELRAAGYKDNAIAAIVGSMQTESSFNPRAANNQSGGHTGLWQWDRTRWPKIAKWIADHGGNPFDAAWQTRAWVAEHNAKPGEALYDHPRTARGGAILRGNPSLEEAIHGVRESERFGVGEEGGRAANARGWLPHVTAAPQARDPVAATSTSPPGASGTMLAAPRALNPPALTRSTPNMTPGGFDPNNIDPKNLMPPAPAAASPTTNNTSNSNRSVHQTINNTTTITGTDRPKEAARVMESAFGRMHGLALANAQSAVA